MQHIEFEPPAELRNTIKCFWYNSRDVGEIPTNFEVQPDGYAEIIFHFGSGCGSITDGVLKPLPSPFIMGLLNQPVTVQATKRLEIIAVRCYPWTVFDLLSLAPGKHIVQICGHPITQLQSPLQELVDAGNIADAVAFVRQYFLNINFGTGFNDTLLKAGKAIKAANGTATVSTVANAAHTTVRTLERKFKQSSGHTVKDVSGLIRFEQVRNQLWLNPETNLAGLSQEAGYTDQAHLSREFKRYSGTTPALFARKAKRGKQTVLNGIVVFIQA